MGEEKTVGAQGWICLILGRVNKPNGKRGGFWQQGVEHESGKDGGDQTAARLYEAHHMWVINPNAGLRYEL